jgi:hypothetical protein
VHARAHPCCQSPHRPHTVAERRNARRPANSSVTQVPSTRSALRAPLAQDERVLGRPPPPFVVSEAERGTREAESNQPARSSRARAHACGRSFEKRSASRSK